MRSDLRQTSLSTILRHLYSERRSGILHVSRHSIKKRVHFREGAIVFADNSDAESEPSRERAREIMFSLFTWTSGDVVFEDWETNISEALAFESATAELILEATRSIEDEEILGRLLGTQESVFACTQTTELPLFKMRLSPAESSVLTFARQRKQDFAGERLFACRNTELAKLRVHKRQSLLQATARELARIQTMVQRARLRGKDKIGARVRKVVTKTLAKYFVLDIRDDDFTFQIPNKEVAAKAALDSIYKRLTKLRSNVELGNLKGKDKIRARVHKLITKKIAKHFDLDIRDDEFRFRIVEQEPAAEAVLNDICKRLESIRSDVKLGKHGGKDNIGVRVGKVINKYKVAKHFVLQIRDDGFDFHIDEHKVASEATLDGIYVIRTSVPEQRLSPDDTVRCYKSLSQVERAFRSIKTIDLKVRPIRHRLETRVRAHIFLCMLAYYVEWHMREAWRPLLFCDEDQEAKKTRDPVAPAKRSEAALRKIRSKKLDDGTEAHSFQTLLKALSTIVRNICRAPGDNPDAPTFQVVTTPDPKQQRAYDLLETIIL